MWELDYKESWVPMNWCFWTVVLEKTLESLLKFKEIQPVHPKGNQSWIFIGRTDAKTETPILWPPDVKNWLIGKDPDAGKDWKWEIFWMLSFKSTFSLSSFTIIKRLFSFSLLSAFRVVSSAYLRLLIFLPANLIPACDLSSLDFTWCTLCVS